MPTVKRGDTIIEVVVAITIFCLVAIISINLMNNGVNTAEGSLELTMARNEIDAQAEALRFIQNSFLAERELLEEQQQYTQLWQRITREKTDCNFINGCGLAIEASELPEFDVDTCDEAYGENSEEMANNNAFVLNTRMLEPSGTSFDYEYYFGTGTTIDSYPKLLEEIVIAANRNSGVFRPTQLYPRLVFTYNSYNSTNNSDNQLVESDEYNASRLYRRVASAEGIWIIAVRGTDDENTGEPQFFDFYIRSCWYGPGQDIPSAIGTIVRLYNPEVVE